MTLSSIDQAAHFLLLEKTLRLMHESGTLTLPQLVDLYNTLTQTTTVPLSIFGTSLYPLEAISLYLHKYTNQNFTQIAKKINRDEKSIWAAHTRAIKKNQKFSLNPSHHIPLEIFNNQTYSLQESLVLYLKKKLHLSHKQIALYLNTSPNSIATIAKRGEKK